MKIDSSDLMTKTDGNVYCKSLSFTNMTSNMGDNRLECIIQAQATSAWIVASNLSNCLACFFDEINSDYKRFDGDHGMLYWVERAG